VFNQGVKMAENQNEKKSLRGFWLFTAGFVSGIAVVVVILLGVYWVCSYNFLQADNHTKRYDSSFEKSYSKFASIELIRAESRFANASDEYAKWTAMDDMAVLLVDAGRLDEAEKFANQLLELAPKYEKDWNYGNAIHKGHISLGRIALRKNDVAAARQHLIKAGMTPGSPQLNSFGPNMLLAKELLEKGERESVIEYLKLCAKFWKSDHEQLQKWETVIKNGDMPIFGSNLFY
jgi:predicted negative regulator of RcsB-dependent stress response